MPPVFLSGVHAFSEKQGAPPKALALPALCLEISVLFMRGGQRRCPPSLEARLILGLSWNQFTLPSTSHCLMAHYRPRCNQIIFHPTVLTFLISISWDVNIPLLSQGLKGQSGSRISSWCWFPFSWTHCHVRYPDLPPSLQSPSWKLCEIKLLSVSKLSKPQEQVSKLSFPWVGPAKETLASKHQGLVLGVRWPTRSSQVSTLTLFSNRHFRVIPQRTERVRAQGHWASLRWERKRSRGAELLQDFVFLITRACNRYYLPK